MVSLCSSRVPTVQFKYLFYLRSINQRTRTMATQISSREVFPTSPLANPKAIIGGADNKYRFTVLTDGLIRYEWADDSHFEDRASTFAICRKLPIPKFRVIENDDSLEIVTEKLRLTYDKKPFSTTGLKVDCLGNISDWHSVWRYGAPVNDLGGTARTLDEADGAIPLEHGVVSKNGYAIVDDSQSMLFDAKGWVAARKPGFRVDGYIFAYGHDFRGALKAFYAVSGKPPLLPRWSLGNWWSRYYAYTADEYTQLMNKFVKEGVPLSVCVLDMDWHEVDIDPKHGSGWTGYSWNKKLFPDPPKFLESLHDRNLKVTLNVHPADGVRSHETSYHTMASALDHPVENEDPIAFDVTNRKFLDSYFDTLHRELEDDGVDFWWVDWQQGPYSKIPGVDPLWMLNHYHFLDNARDGNRPLTFSRYAGPGSHRYPVGFSGDTVVTWASLAYQPEFTATASNIGYGWWSHDIGGHMQGYKNDEMAARWVWLGCFSPILRLHSSNNPFNVKTPWSYSKATCSSMISALRLRHRLVPYLYTMNYLSARDGVPLCLPMYYDHPKNDKAYEVPNQFLFGSELLVIPISTPLDPVTRLAETKGWLPPGRYIDIFTSTVYDGNRFVTFHRDLDNYPVLAKEGSIIPLDASAVPENGCVDPTTLEILIVVGKDGYFELLEDDGTGSSIDSVKTIKTPIKLDHEKGEITIGPTIGHPDPSSKRDYVITLLGLKPEQSTDQSSVSNSSLETENDSSKVSLNIKVISEPIIFRIPPGQKLTPTDVNPRVFKIIDDAQIAYGDKSRAFRSLSKGALATNEGNEPGSKNVVIGDMMSQGMHEKLREAVLEIMLADGRSKF